MLVFVEANWVSKEFSRFSIRLLEHPQSVLNECSATTSSVRVIEK